MKRPNAYKFFLLAATIAASGSLALLSGCKGNTSAAAVPDKILLKPPILQITQAATDPSAADPLTSTVWLSASWNALVAPIHSVRTTGAVRAAILFDASNLYVAFVSDEPTVPVTQDFVSVYLDSSAVGNGSEMVAVAVQEGGKTNCTWIRSTTPPMPREDGSPDFTHPQSRIPDVMVKGLGAKMFRGVENGAAVWSTVVTIPLKNLPAPLRTTPVAGSHFKINLFRSTRTADTGTGTEMLQANLSPVTLGAQSLSPQRMAELVISPPEFTAVPMAPRKQF